MVQLGLVPSRSQAESYIKLGRVRLNGQTITKPGHLVSLDQLKGVRLIGAEQYVSRAGLKLSSVAKALKLDFNNKVVLDVGSSTGGFSEYALINGAKKVVAVDSGTEQLHPSLRDNPKIELHEKTDIRDFKPNQAIDLVLIDVSFISLRQILPQLRSIILNSTEVVAMVKPQFEAQSSSLKHKGVIKNDRMRRQILKDFEAWVKPYFLVKDKLDSEISGAKGNLERFYILQPV